MKAWQYTSVTGGIEKNLAINQSAPLPKPTSKEHLVEIVAVALNPVDYKPAEVPFFGRLLVPNPATPCIDFVGRLKAPAAGSPLKPGQLVFGGSGKTPFAGGALAEFASASVDGVVAVPEGMNLVDAASIGTAGLTAYQSIVPHVKEGDKVFINGGSGGVGAFGIQIAKTLGCHVTTTCSTANVELCKSLGADAVVDYTKGSVADALRDAGHRFHHMVDNVGADPSLYFRAHEYSEPSAAFVGVAGAPSLSFVLTALKMRLLPGFLGGGKRKCMGFFAKAKQADLEAIGAWMQEGKVKALIDSQFAFEDAPQAFEKLKTGRARGKIVVNVASSTPKDA